MNLITRSLIAAVAVVAMAGAAPARTMPLLKATVPFEFYVGNKLMPAGSYTVERHGLPNMVVVRNSVTRQTVVVLCSPTAAGRSKGQLIFRNQGGRNVLVEVTGSGEEAGRMLATR